MEVKQRTARSLIHRLTTATTTTTATLSEIRLLCKHDPEIRTLFADSGLIPILTDLILQDQGNRDQADQDLVGENACATLLNLSISAAESLMSTPSLLPSLAHALRSPNPALPQHAAATLYSLLTVDAYRPIIGSKLNLISSLISLLKSPNSPTRSVKDSLKALFGIALYPLNRPSLVDLGAVPALFSLLVKDGRTGMMEDTSAVIAQVAGCYECVDAFRKVGGVRILVGLVEGKNGTSERVKENAASALLNLAMSGGERAVGDIREVEAAEEAVRELAERGSTRAKSKADSLLTVLKSGRGSLAMIHRFGAEFDRFSESPARWSSSADSTSL